MSQNTKDTEAIRVETLTNTLQNALPGNELPSQNETNLMESSSTFDAELQRKKSNDRKRTPSSGKLLNPPMNRQVTFSRDFSPPPPQDDYKHPPPKSDPSLKSFHMNNRPEAQNFSTMTDSKSHEDPYLSFHSNKTNHRFDGQPFTTISSSVYEDPYLSVHSGINYRPIAYPLTTFPNLQDPRFRLPANEKTIEENFQLPSPRELYEKKNSVDRLKHPILEINEDTFDILKREHQNSLQKLGMEHFDMFDKAHKNIETLEREHRNSLEKLDIDHFDMFNDAHEFKESGTGSALKPHFYPADHEELADWCRGFDMRSLENSMQKTRAKNSITDLNVEPYEDKQLQDTRQVLIKKIQIVIEKEIKLDKEIIHWCKKDEARIKKKKLEVKRELGIVIDKIAALRRKIQLELQ